MINLVLFYCGRAQGYFGLGTHVTGLVEYFKGQQLINITIVYTESQQYPEVMFESEDGIDHLHIPSPENGLALSDQDNPITATLAQRILQVTYPYLKNKEKMICWFNSVTEFHLIRQVKEFYQCRILYVHHGWYWMDSCNTSNEIFSAEWKKGNKDFSPAAFTKASCQLEIVSHSDITVTVTHQARQYYIDTFDVPDSKLVTIYNGISELPLYPDQYKHSLRKELGIAPEERVILFSGRVVENKGIFYLISAFKQLLAKLPDSRLVLIGNGALKEVLEASMPHWTKITVTHLISRDWLLKWYAIADAGILPSLMEQCSYTAIEMRFSGLPLIVTATDGQNELFECGKDCLTLPIHYDENGKRTLVPDEITERLHTILTDKDLSSSLAHEGYRKASSHFNIERMGSQYLQTIQSLWQTFLFLLIIALSSCGSTSAPEVNPEPKENIPLSVTTTVTKVTCVKAVIKPFQYLINTNGKIRALQEQLIIAESGGRLLNCRVKTGTAFSKGELMLQFETAAVRFRMEKARLVQYNSSKEYESQLLGYENLLKDKTKEEADGIRQKLRISTGLAGAEQDIREAEYELSKATITAPFSGIAADVNVQQAQLVRTGDQLFRLYDPASFLLEIKVLETDIALLHKGIPAEVSPVAAPERKYAATLHEINPQVDENGMVLIRLHITGSRSRELFPGMNCMATIKMPTVKTIVVPKEAVVMRGGKAVVFTLDNGQAKWNYVITGKENGKEVEIREGLTPGSKVITTNNLQLAHQAPVQEEINPE